jgi:hypothetical protein
MRRKNNIAGRAATVAALCAVLVFAFQAAAQEQESRTIITVKQLVESPADYAGKVVVAVGMFMGTDGACAGRMDARDWMLQGEGRDCVWVRVEPPQGCVTATKVGVGRTVAVEGMATMTKNRPMLMPVRAPAKASAPAGAQRQQQAQQPRKDPKEIQKERKEAAEQRQLEIERERDASQSFSPGELLQNPALFAGMTDFFVAGKYRGDAAGCGSDAPAAVGEWAVEDLLGNCVRARGPAPERAGSVSALADGELVSFKAAMKIESASGSATHYLLGLPRPEEFKPSAPEMKPAAKPISN